MAIEIPMPKLGLTMEEATDHPVARRRRRRRRSRPADPPHRDRQDRDRGRCAGERPAPPDRRAGRRVRLRPADRAAARRGRDAAGTGAAAAPAPPHQHRRSPRPAPAGRQRSPAPRPASPAGGRLLRVAERAVGPPPNSASRCARCGAPGPAVASSRRTSLAAPAGAAHAAPRAGGFAVASVAARNLADLLGVDLAERARRSRRAPHHPRRCRRARSPAPRSAAPARGTCAEPIRTAPSTSGTADVAAAPAGAHRDDPAVGHARHDRQADARLVAGDGAADADDGRRHDGGARRPRRPQGRRRRSGAVDHRLRGRRRPRGRSPCTRA